MHEIASTTMGIMATILKKIKITIIIIIKNKNK